MLDGWLSLLDILRRWGDRWSVVVLFYMLRNVLFWCAMDLVVLHISIDVFDDLSFSQFINMKKFVMIVLLQLQNFDKNGAIDKWYFGS